MRLVPLPALVFALLLTVLQPLLAAVRWHLILRRLGGTLSLLRTLKTYWIGLFAGSLFAGVITGDGMRMWILSRAGLRPSKSVNSVLLDRAAALIGLLLLVAATLPFLDNRVADAALRYGASLLLLAGVAVCCSVGLMTRVPAQWQKYRLARAVLHVTNDLWSIWRSPSLAAALLLLSVLSTLCNALSIFVLIRSLDVSVDLVDTMVLSPLVILVITLPVSVGGWGLREASMPLSVRASSSSEEDAFRANPAIPHIGISRCFSFRARDTRVCYVPRNRCASGLPRARRKRNTARPQS